jgi:hypothetical protein
MKILNRAKLTFPKFTVLKSNLALDVSFSAATYEVKNLEIENKLITFNVGNSYFRNVDAAKLGIDIQEKKD